VPEVILQGHQKQSRRLEAGETVAYGKTIGNGYVNALESKLAVLLVFFVMLSMLTYRRRFVRNTTNI
jgi:hypothetical protein